MTEPKQNDRIYRVWSSRREDQIAVRIVFSVEEAAGCRVFQIHNREEWA